MPAGSRGSTYDKWAYLKLVYIGDFILSLQDQVMADVNTRTSLRKQIIRVESGWNKISLTV